MNDQQLCGTWTGAYTYGNEYDVPLKGKMVTFEMKLTIVNGVITGECIDAESTKHFKAPAIIEGSMGDDHSIKFVKRYPHYWQHEKSGQRFLPKLPSQEIYYSGAFVNNEFEGEWEIVTVLVDAQGEMVTYRGYGSWGMKRLVDKVDKAMGKGSGQ
ncbi:hypothetical protein A4H97_21935 [Niastella yeongjuensis]|uniref:Lipocalin-like domain-containing protein n=1 Tax=Niastella yeongjuensis TaxID=354355 RepID=A0A1V9F8Q8_9BACT|nr:hypothetical protein [Niastella yeongjuensis]OQP54627.1 hypothetical protein A4H97_21935 [Niastella yeongjuensis]SEO01462.1 hypothetical protein SAMN05660816_01902 [Niastella yeongjuensis]